MRLLTSESKVIDLSRQSRPDVFKAALCSLGSLGVILTCTIRVEKLFYLSANTSVLRFDDMVSNMKQLAASSEHVRFWWFPHTENCIQWKANRIEKVINNVWKLII